MPAPDPHSLHIAQTLANQPAAPLPPTQTSSPQNPLPPSPASPTPSTVLNPPPSPPSPDPLSTLPPLPTINPTPTPPLDLTSTTPPPTPPTNNPEPTPPISANTTAPPPPDPANQESPPEELNPPISKSNLPFKTGVVAVLMFMTGLGSVFGYSHYFLDSTPPPPLKPQGQLLGAIEEATPSATPIPTPNLTPMPETLEEPFAATLAFLQDNQVFTIKTDRTDPDQITDDNTQKSSLAQSPDGLSLAYVFVTSDDPPEAGIAVVNRQTKEIKVIYQADSNPLPQIAHLTFSPSDEHLSAWVDSGQSIIVIDIKDKSESLRFSTEEKTGVSPITWLNGQNRVSFILETELFVMDPTGDNPESLAKNVIGIKTDTQDNDIPLPPVWSTNNQYVAYIRADGLYYLDLESRQETTVIKADEAFELKNNPFQAIGFTASNSHLLYTGIADEGGQSMYAYSLTERLSVTPGNYGPSALLNPFNHLLIGLTTTDSGLTRLARYSLEKWEEDICLDSSFTFTPPARTTWISPSLNTLLGLDIQDQVSTINLIDLESCDSYELIKSQNLSSPIWLPN